MSMSDSENTNASAVVMGLMPALYAAERLNWASPVRPSLTTTRSRKGYNHQCRSTALRFSWRSGSFPRSLKGMISATLALAIEVLLTDHGVRLPELGEPLVGHLLGLWPEVQVAHGEALHDGPGQHVHRTLVAHVVAVRVEQSIGDVPRRPGVQQPRYLASHLPAVADGVDRQPVLG